MCDDLLVNEQITPVPKPQLAVQNPETTVAAAEAGRKSADATPVPPPKVDVAIDLFNMLSMDGPEENGSEVASADDNLWAGFQCMSQISLVVAH